MVTVSIPHNLILNLIYKNPIKRGATTKDFELGCMCEGCRSLPLCQPSDMRYKALWLLILMTTNRRKASMLTRAS